MKPATSITLASLVGLAVGTFYGYRTGFDDGQGFAHMLTMGAIEDYGTLRTSSDTAARDVRVDFMATHSAYVFTDSSYSPLFPFVRRMLDRALLGTAAYWELNSREPSVWKNGEQPPLFPEGSPQATRLQKLKEKLPADYGRELEKQRKKREIAKLRNA